MRRWATVTLVLALTSLCIAQTAPLVPPEVLAQIKDDDPNLLPRYMTAAERLIPLPVPLRSEPPTGDVHCATEYDLNEGMLIRWGHYNSMLTELTVGVTTLDPQAITYILVTGPSQQSSATATLTSAGANMAQVEFITYTTNTGWIRDYGPRFVFEDGIRVIIDHTYNRPRPLDNAFPDFLASFWGEPEYDMPLVHGGGNFHSFANGDAFMSDLILLENPGLSEQDVKDIIQDYKGCDLTIYEGFPWSVDGTKHIDMWMQPLDDYKVIIGQYSQTGTYPPQQITDGAAADLIARGYTVYRTPGWNSGSGGYNGTHYTYTNSVILNDLVFISSFSGYPTQNAEALAVFQTALPDHQIIQIDCSSIIHAAGAIHCSMMHVPGYDLGPVPLVNVLSPDGGEVWTVGQEYDIRWIAIDNVAVTSVDIHLSTDGGASFPHEIATGLANSGVYAWEVPALPSEQCRVKVVAHDGEGNFGEDTSDGDFTITSFGPQVVYEFLMDTDPGWSTEDLWAFGQPTGGGGQYGGPDPTSGHTGDNVYGYNLSGDYQPNLPERHLTSNAIDCTGLGGVTLGFWRWLGVEQPAYDHAYVRVSNDGGNWQTVWQNTAEVADYAWAYQEYDISTVADDQATVYLRWTMGTTDYTWQYCGWNIDDVQIIAVPTVLLGDLNCDGALNAFDIDPFVLALTDPAGYAAAWPDCDRMLADCNGDGEINAFDIDPFVELLTGP